MPFLWDEKKKSILNVYLELLYHARFHGSGKFEESFLFTHKGLSGPAILQISNFWDEGEVVKIDLLPDQSEEFLFDAKKKPW